MTSQNIYNDRSSHPKKLIVYNTGAIGDLLVSTATLHAIALLFPFTEQTLIGNSIWKDLLLPTQWTKIENFIECERKSLKKLVLYKPNLEQNKWERIRDIPSLSKFLKDYTIGINLRNRSLRFALALFAARVKVRIGAHLSRFARHLYTHFTWESNIVHERDRCLSVLSSYNKDFFEQQMEYWKIHGLPRLKEIDSQKFKKKFGDSFIVINPTASIREKASPAKNFKMIVDILVNTNKNPIVVGAPNETSWLKEIATDKAPIYQSESIFDIYDLIAAAKLLVTNTSSLQFIAASIGTPTITLMGSANPIEWSPLGRNDLLLKAEPSHDDAKIQKDRRLNKVERKKKLEEAAYARISVQSVLDAIHKISI